MISLNQKWSKRVAKLVKRRRRAKVSVMVQRKKMRKKSKF